MSDLASLNPYRRDVVPGSLLEVEDVNIDAETGARRQLWCVSIAAKRYALFTRDEAGEPTIVPGTTRHGLGFLIDPRDSSDDVAKWLAPWEHALWEDVVRESLGLSAEPPSWHDRPAVMRHTVSSPVHLRAFECLNRGKPYAEQVKPFNFMLAVPVEAQGRPDGLPADAPLTRVAPYKANPRRWALRNWYDVYTGNA